MYIETMKKVFGNTDNVIIDDPSGKGGGVVPYLPLSRTGKAGVSP